VIDPNPRRPAPPPVLEPWALDLLERENAADPRAREETARVVALLRQLGDPERDPDRVARLLAMLEAERSRPTAIRVAHGVARKLTRPPVALALAAGMAGLLAITVAPEALLPTPGSQVDAIASRSARDPDAETVRAAAPARPATVPVRRRVTPVIRPQLVNVSAFSPPSLGDRLETERDFAHGLDRQLNQLMIDPDAFALRLERVSQRDRLIARLANRAAERGDAPAIALRVRQSRHPLAGTIVERMLNATMVARLPQRR